MTKRTVLIFGAGNIGLGFVGQIFGRSGWNVTFADTDPAIVTRLERDRGYSVEFLSPDGGRETCAIGPVEAWDARDPERLRAALADRPLLATSVGARAFPAVLRAIGAAIGVADLDLIAAENIHDPREVTRSVLGAAGPAVHPCSVGKMVPVQDHATDGPLTIRTEAFNELIVDGTGWRTPFPSDVAWLRPVPRIEAWMDRKLFVHNFGHSVCAWRARAVAPEIETIAEAIAIPAIRRHTRAVMVAAGRVVDGAYADEFGGGAMADHVDDLLFRFANRSLGDTVERVGRDVQRKLGREERFVGALRLAARTAESARSDAGDRLLRLASEIASDALAFGASPRSTLDSDRMLAAQGARDVAGVVGGVAQLDRARDDEDRVLRALAGRPAVDEPR